MIKLRTMTTTAKYTSLKKIDLNSTQQNFRSLNSNYQY